MNRVRGKVKIVEVWPPILAIAGMSLSLAVVLLLLGILGQMNGVLEMIFTPRGLVRPERSLDAVFVWVGAGLLAVWMPAVVFHVQGMGKRIFLWLLTVFVTVVWAPVLVIAAYRPEISAPLVVVVWAGICAVFYASKHALPVDVARQITGN